MSPDVEWTRRRMGRWEAHNGWVVAKTPEGWAVFRPGYRPGSPSATAQRWNTSLAARQAAEKMMGL